MELCEGGSIARCSSRVDQRRDASQLAEASALTRVRSCQNRLETHQVRLEAAQLLCWAAAVQGVRVDRLERDLETVDREVQELRAERLPASARAQRTSSYTLRPRGATSGRAEESEERSYARLRKPIAVLECPEGRDVRMGRLRGLGGAG